MSSMKNGTKKYYCTPTARILPIFFALGGVFCAYLAYIAFTDPKQSLFGAIGAILWMCIAFGMAIFCESNGSRYVLLYDDRIICKCIFRKDIVLEYNKCTVGMDYAKTTGTTNIWIYFVYGTLPKYKLNNEANRINSLKFRQGFIKMMYNEEVYNALLEVLPKNQRNGLISGYKLYIEK